MRRFTGALTGLLLVAPHFAAAQSELVLDAGVGVFAGPDFAGTPAGPSVAVAIYFADWASAHGGVEFGYSRHGGGRFESATTQLEYVGVARYQLTSGRVSAFAGGKLGAGWRMLKIVGDPAKTDGFILGPSAAVRFSVGTVRVQVTLDALYETFEELTMYGSREYGTDKDGLRLVLRAGFVIPIEGLRSRMRG